MYMSRLSVCVMYICKAMNLLELVLQAAGSCPRWMLGTEFRSSKREARGLKC